MHELIVDKEILRSSNGSTLDHRSRILILGAKGMLGHALAKVFEDFQPILWDYEELDITKRDEVIRAVVELSPTFIINAAAYTAVDLAEKERFNAFAINSSAIKNLTEASLLVEATLVHYSTDYVFSGSCSEGYLENAVPGPPLNIYGESKLSGEKYLQSSKVRTYLIRTAWLFGAHGKNFVNTMMKLTRERSHISIVHDQVGSPTYALDLAIATRQLLHDSYQPGVYHLVNSGRASWYDLAVRIVECMQLPCRVESISSNDYPTIARRPRWSILLNTRGPELRHWSKALEDYLLPYKQKMERITAKVDKLEN